MKKTRLLVCCVILCLSALSVLGLFLYQKYLYSATQYPFTEVNYGDPEPALSYSANVTWKDYTGLEGWDEGRHSWSKHNAEAAAGRARYVVNGEYVGSGAAGFCNVITRLEKLPKGSAVKMFPNYYAFEALVHRGVAGVRVPVFPFHMYSGDLDVDLRRAAWRRNLQIVLSLADEKGQYPAEFVEALKAARGTLMPPD